MTLAELQLKMQPFLNTLIHQPRTSNKGEVGVLLEKLTGIPQSSVCLDCQDGELKVFPVKRNAKGALVPKETIAVTMLSKDELKAASFSDSRVCKKMTRMLVVPYERTGDKVRYLEPTLVDSSSEKFKETFGKLECDYNAIRAAFLESGELKSSVGALMQNRTKGAGHGTTSRAFYLKKEFIKENILIPN